jgi:predicted ATPase/DNA-binding XRE family transcriptional regulator/Tfp pilus assembly protein PilF
LAEVSFGEWLKRRRKSEGWTQEQLAQQVSCSTITLRKIESEERRPSAQIVERLAEIFDIPRNEHTALLRFARGDWKFSPSAESEEAPWRVPVTSPRSNLPASLTSLIGREQEIASVREYLSNPSIRLVTLIGPPGIGKTRLSLEIARKALSDFSKGVFFVALAPLEEPSFVAPTIAQTLGFIETKNRSLFERLKDGIGEKQMLIVLDNVEHLIEGTATLVSDLLAVCPRLKILTTSREALRVPGEWLYPVPALSIPAETQRQPIDIETALQFAALSLFVERARAVRSDFALNVENVQAVASICTQLDGLPLAIELIAARVRLMSPQSLLSHLSEQFTQYADGMRAVSARQKTLHNAIGWSYDLLPAKEQVLFRRLAAFVGGWTLEAAQAVCSVEGLEANEVPDLLMHLVDKSLVIVREQDGKERYHTLETIRQYAREKLWAAGEGEILRQRHLAYFVNLAERAEANLRAFDMVMWLDRLEAELDNIRAALVWSIESDVEAELRLASALLWFWHIRGHKNEGIEWLERGLSMEAAGRGHEPLTPDRALIRGKVLNATGFLLAMLGNYEKTVALSEEALALFRELGSRGKIGMAYALWNSADAGGNQGDLRRAKVLAEESLTLLQEAGDKFGMAQCLNTLAWLEELKGDFDKVKTLLEESLALRKEIGDKDGIAGVLARLGTLAFWQGDLIRSVTSYEESLAVFREVGNEWARGYALADLALVARAQGEYGKATLMLEEGLTTGEEVGDKLRVSQSLQRLASVAQSQGDYERATRIYEETLLLAREVGEPHTIANSLQGLGNIALARGDYRQATQQFEAELFIGQEKKIRWINAYALSRLGRVAWAQGDFELASIRLEQALTTCREAGAKNNIGFVLYYLGRVFQSQRDYVSARAHYIESLAVAREFGSRDGIASNLEALAALCVAQSQMEPSLLRFEDLRRATRLFGAAENLYPPLRFEMSAAERDEHDQAVAAARAALGEEAFAAAWAEGRAMTMEQSITYALEETDE